MFLDLCTFYFQVSEHYDDYRYGKVMQTVEKFINIEVSNFYCSIIKDRLVYNNRYLLYFLKKVSSSKSVKSRYMHLPKINSTSISTF